MLIPTRECPQSGIEAPRAFPREPEPRKNLCQILPRNPGNLDPEAASGAPAITETEIGTKAVAAAAVEEAVVAKAAVAPAPDVDHAANPSPSHSRGGKSS